MPEGLTPQYLMTTSTIPSTSFLGRDFGHDAVRASRRCALGTRCHHDIDSRITADALKHSVRHCWSLPSFRQCTDTCPYVQIPFFWLHETGISLIEVTELASVKMSLTIGASTPSLKILPKRIAPQFSRTRHVTTRDPLPNLVVPRYGTTTKFYNYWGRRTILHQRDPDILH